MTAMTWIIFGFLAAIVYLAIHGQFLFAFLLFLALCSIQYKSKD